MRALRMRFIVALAAGIAAGSAPAAGQETGSGRGYPAGDWPLVGGNWSSSRHTTLADIDRETVDRLAGAWVTRLEGGASSRATPVVQDGVLYLTGGANVFAIDARTARRCGAGSRWPARRRGSPPGRARGWATTSSSSVCGAPR